MDKVVVFLIDHRGDFAPATTIRELCSVSGLVRRRQK
ncbi:hypothetical protein SAMN06264849_104171 [Melghirimyces algeriensis]|uniref:Uncharacterized protein n=1 Tax=Melghirimyces algeriensis TaxID=910412 RepID=A0A521CTK3_9BACL|nr:hypothetical protein SAMN06264849_104171 [Melghirimyces algeriensis]